MKCDELEAEQWLDYSGEPMPCYPKAKVDAAIEELKAAHHKERHEYIKMVAQLKKKLEDVQATAYAESVDAGMRERKLKRALYKACSNWMIDRQLAMKCFHLEARAKKFDKAIEKCRAKAEEYK